MNRITLALMMLGLTACATTMTEDEVLERMEREQETREKYAMCRGAWEYAGVIWVQQKQSQTGYDRKTGYPKHAIDMNMEMRYNQCNVEL